MTFHTLEDKFNAMSKDIYGRFSNPGQIDTPIRPDASTGGGIGRDIKTDSRTLPIVSTGRDTQLVGKFLTTGKGLLFLSKQGFLQTGNTFAETRLYNPAGPLLHTVPFVHATRHISKGNGGDIKSILSSNRNDRGALQTETVGKVEPSANLQSRIQDRIKSIFSNVQQVKINEQGGRGHFYQRPEDVAFTETTGPIRYATQTVGQRGEPKKPASTDTETTFADAFDNYKSSTFGHLPYLSGFIGNGYLETSKNFNTLDYKNENVELAATSNVGMIGDFYNMGATVDGNSQKITDLAEGRLLYDSIAGERRGSTDNEKADIIKFVFESVGSDPVYFRAFISSIKQNIKTEFNSQRYVGRNERFVTYGGATRTLALSFNIVAFSKSELDNMWLRVNYLTGLAFPKSVSESGFMTPPLFKLTVGGLYDGHPCYIESLDFDFLDETITFDIDSEVSQVINVTMTLSLLEKRSRFYDSPFYAIAEKAATNLSLLSARNKRVDSAAADAIRRNNPFPERRFFDIPDPLAALPEPIFKTPLEAVSAPAVQETSDKSTVTRNPSPVPATATPVRRPTSNAVTPSLAIVPFGSLIPESLRRPFLPLPLPPSGRRRLRRMDSLTPADNTRVTPLRGGSGGRF